MTASSLVNPFSEPYGWIQFKGSTLCIDISCECGEGYHYDGSFCYFIRCPNCKKVFALNGHISLHEAQPEEYDERNVMDGEADDWEDDLEP